MPERKHTMEEKRRKMFSAALRGVDSLLSWMPPRDMILSSSARMGGVNHLE